VFHLNQLLLLLLLLLSSSRLVDGAGVGIIPSSSAAQTRDRWRQRKANDAIARKFELEKSICSVVISTGQWHSLIKLLEVFLGFGPIGSLQVQPAPGGLVEREGP
jgi:hypothetical protein